MAGPGLIPAAPAGVPTAPARAVAASILRIIVFNGAVLSCYFLLPHSENGAQNDVFYLFVQLLIFAAIVALQVPMILRARYPGLRAVEATVLTLVIYLTVFARFYLTASAVHANAFTVPLDHISALYFTVTVFATVGFGDITAQTQPMMVLVTIQMILNLAFIGVVVKVLVHAANRGMTRKIEGEPELPRGFWLPGKKEKRAAESASESEADSGAGPATEPAVEPGVGPVAGPATDPVAKPDDGTAG